MNLLGNANAPQGEGTVYIGNNNTVGQQEAMPAVRTLVRALSNADDLNKRLFSLKARVIEIAQAVGGPYPAPDGESKALSPSSAMHRLNDAVDTAHATVSEIDNAIAAIARSLGG